MKEYDHSNQKILSKLIEVYEKRMAQLKQQQLQEQALNSQNNNH